MATMSTVSTQKDAASTQDGTPQITQQPLQVFSKDSFFFFFLIIDFGFWNVFSFVIRSIGYILFSDGFSEAL